MAEAATNLGWNRWVQPLPGDGFAPGRSWFDAGVEMRRRMALCGYRADELWAVNEVHSGVRRNNGNSRPNWLDFMRGLYAYDRGGSSPPGACGPPGDHVWCDAFVDGASFTDLWDLFNVWGAVR
jgi:hypothetical protein